MTTLSKEDVVRWAREAGCNIITTPDDVIARYNDVRVTNMLGRFAEAARADLLAENERLKATPPDQRQDLHCVVSDIAAECRELHDQLTATRTELAAAEADNERLREALSMHIHLVESNAPELSGKAHGFAKDALAKPRDDSALREMIAGVYEECAKVCDLFEQKADALNDSIADDDGANEGRSEYIMGKATASSRIAKAIRALSKALHEKNGVNTLDLLGHENDETGRIYSDPRGGWVEVKLPKSA